MSMVETVLTSSVPSVLVILSWIHNNTRLSRLELSVDGTNRRIDEVQRDMHDLRREIHNDMVSFQSSLLGEIASIRERIAVVESSR
jgi:hypothetical protein